MKPSPGPSTASTGARALAHKAALALAWMVAACAAPAQARPLTIANFGGANGQAQAEAFLRPFAREHRIEVTAIEYTGGLAAVADMAKKGQVSWDVMEVESADLAAGCKAGLFERLPRAELQHAGMMLPTAVHECGVGAFVWSTVLAYDANRLKEAPKGWADFWDTAKFPGKRGLRKGARYNMEFALLADGVHRNDVYATLGTEAGVARALDKLKKLKPHIVWWDAGAQPPQLLAAGEVAMSSAFNGRVPSANRPDGPRLQIVWAGAVYELDYWVIVKGTPLREQAMKYINFATSESAQLAFSREIPYGPTHFNAILKYDSGRARANPVPTTSTQQQALVDLSMVESDLPSAPANFRKSLAFDAAFWDRHGNTLERRFKLAME